MAGVINILSKTPKKKLEGMVKLKTGTYHTRSVLGELGTLRALKNGGKFLASGNGSFRKNDGYIPEPQATRNQYDVKTYLDEINAGAMVRYLGPGKKDVLLR